MGNLAATGRKVSVPWVIITRFAGERISEDWELYDENGLLHQLDAGE
jgi:predicted ester cyclase